MPASTSMSPPPGAILASKVTAAGALGFVPVAVHFRLLQTLVNIGHAASSEEILKKNDEERTEDEKQKSPLCLKLLEDTLFILSGQSFLDLVDDNIFAPNDITRHFASLPSAPHGALHFTTEVLFSSAFLMRKLQSTNFTYPFLDKQTPTQYGYALLGETELAKQHTYSIMAAQGRIESFNTFMAGKFGAFGTFPSRAESFRYDLHSALFNRDSVSQSDIAMVDIGGGTGEMLHELQAAFPELRTEQLVVEEFNGAIDSVPGLTFVPWDFTSDTQQPVKGARCYNMSHILHNQSDLLALDILRKIADAMGEHSRLLIQEFSKNVNYGNMLAAMICLYAGRVRSKKEWHRMAKIVGLEITFEVFPQVGEGLIEMRKQGGKGDEEGAGQLP